MGYKVSNQENPITENTLSEETRHMINEQLDNQWLNHYKTFFDALTMTPHERRRHDRQQLGKRVRQIAIDLELSGRDDDARVLMLAAGALIGSDDE